MQPPGSRLPTVFGSAAALAVTAISYVAQASPESCVLRATAAFVVFAAFGIVLRYLLADAASATPSTRRSDHARAGDIGAIEPGTSVEELLAAQESDAG